MTRRATIKTVAAEAGVSVSTVSQVLRGEGRISDDTRRKVQRAAEKVKYVANRGAAAMRSGHSKDIGLLIHNIRNPFNAEVVLGVNSYLEEQGYLVFVLDALDDLARQKRYLATMLGGSPGGLLWVPASGTDQATVDWVASHSPTTISFLRPLPGDPFDHVGIDSTRGAALATRHLLELGHRQIAFLGGDPASETITQRIGGYVTEMLKVGGGTVIRPCEETKAAAMEAAIALMQETPNLTGIVCNCDVVAMGATLGLRRLGLEAGQDVSVTGFDGIEDARLWSPPLTTVEVDPMGIGQQLAETLLERSVNRLAPVRTINLPVRLEARASTGGVHGNA